MTFSSGGLDPVVGAGGQQVAFYAHGHLSLTTTQARSRLTSPLHHLDGQATPGLRRSGPTCLPSGPALQRAAVGLAAAVGVSQHLCESPGGAILGDTAGTSGEVLPWQRTRPKLRDGTGEHFQDSKSLSKSRTVVLELIKQQAEKKVTMKNKTKQNK